MADKIKIHTGRLGSDAERILSCISRITKETDAMKSSAASLKNMWEGPGSQAFYKSFQDDIDAMEAVIKNVKSIYDYDTNAKKEYEDCERKISSMIAELKL